MKLVSIIVPAYNVEKTIEKCLKSLMAQTYSNIEIIVVDDGSKDRTFSISQAIGKIDDRISIFHKDNGGLSDARNYGKNLAKGDYIAFVDSDDYVHPDMYRRLVSVMDDKNADICCCGYYRTSLGGHEVSSVFGSCVSMDGIHAAKDLINQVAFNNFAWNKLYKKELFNEINFPVGRTYEDILTTYKVFMKAKIVVGIEDPLYYYVENSSSISSSLTNIIGLWESVNEQMQQMVAFFPELKNDCDRRIIETAKYIIIKYLQAGYNRNSDEMANIKRQLSLQASDFEYSIKKYAYRIIRFPRIYYMIYKFKILYMKFKKNIKGR